MTSPRTKEPHFKIRRAKKKPRCRRASDAAKEYLVAEEDINANDVMSEDRTYRSGVRPTRRGRPRGSAVRGRIASKKSRTHRLALTLRSPSLTRPVMQLLQDTGFVFFIRRWLGLSKSVNQTSPCSFQCRHCWRQKPTNTLKQPGETGNARAKPAAVPRREKRTADVVMYRFTNQPQRVRFDARAPLLSAARSARGAYTCVDG